MNYSLLKKLLLVCTISSTLTPTIQCLQDDQILNFGEQLYKCTAALTVIEPVKPVKELIISLNNDPHAQDILTKAQEAGLQKYTILAKAREIAEVTDGQDALCTKTLTTACKQDWHYWVELVKPYTTYIATGAVTAIIIGLLAKLYVRRPVEITTVFVPNQIRAGTGAPAITPSSASSTPINNPPYVPVRPAVTPASTTPSTSTTSTPASSPATPAQPQPNVDFPTAPAESLSESFTIPPYPTDMPPALPAGYSPQVTPTPTPAPSTTNLQVPADYQGVSVPHLDAYQKMTHNPSPTPPNKPLPSIPTKSLQQPPTNTETLVKTPVDLTSLPQENPYDPLIEGPTEDLTKPINLGNPSTTPASQPAYEVKVIDIPNGYGVRWQPTGVPTEASSSTRKQTGMVTAEIAGTEVDNNDLLTGQVFYSPSSQTTTQQTTASVAPQIMGNGNSAFPSTFTPRFNSSSPTKGAGNAGGSAATPTSPNTVDIDALITSVRASQSKNSIGTVDQAAILEQKLAAAQQETGKFLAQAKKDVDTINHVQPQPGSSAQTPTSPKPTPNANRALPAAPTPTTPPAAPAIDKLSQGTPNVQTTAAPTSTSPVTTAPTNTIDTVYEKEQAKNTDIVHGALFTNIIARAGDDDVARTLAKYQAEIDTINNRFEELNRDATDWLTRSMIASQNKTDTSAQPVLASAKAKIEQEHTALQTSINDLASSMHAELNQKITPHNATPITASTPQKQPEAPRKETSQERLAQAEASRQTAQALQTMLNLQRRLVEDIKETDLWDSIRIPNNS